MFDVTIFGAVKLPFSFQDSISFNFLTNILVLKIGLEHYSAVQLAAVSLIKLIYSRHRTIQRFQRKNI